jgi:glycosyltransferase involved in cell wall biosynthesis
LGVLEDAEMDVVLGAADLALNPTTSGSGTNLKMLQYAAGGIPILTTPFGNRGLELCPDVHLWQAPLAEFPATIAQIQRQDLKERNGMVGRARDIAERHYDWRVIADGIELPTHRLG